MHMTKLMISYDFTSQLPKIEITVYIPCNCSSMPSWDGPCANTMTIMSSHWKCPQYGHIPYIYVTFAHECGELIY